MATVKLSRNIILSLKDFFDPLLTAEGYDFSFISAWTEDNKIVVPNDYVANQGLIKLPAGKITISSRNQGSYIEVGGGTQYTDLYINFFIHAITEGQIYDLLDLFHTSLTDGANKIGGKIISINNYTTTGYPTSTPVKAYDMEVFGVGQKIVPGLGEDNIALRYAGMVGFSGKILRRVGL